MASPRLNRARTHLRRLPPAAAILSLADRRRSRQVEAEGDAREVSKSRWRAAPPTSGLTWGVELRGDAFVERAEHHGAFGADRAILEIGPGYGRVLRACLDREVGFSRYVGLDLSEQNVEHLRGTFGSDSIEFRHGDAERTALGESFDTVLSSLTFKHLYPSFEPALANLRPQLAANAVVIFDLIEGGRRYFQHDRRTFIREYGRDEVRASLDAAGYELVAFDEVRHAEGYARLLVVARPRPVDRARAG